MIEVSDWHGLYRESWRGVITPAAFAHPAKYARALIRHIYVHLAELGWIEAGSTVLDPFGGVALGAFDAQRHGCHWIGIEVEPRFVALGSANLALWQRKYAPHVAAWGSARMLLGDSRQLLTVVSAADAAVSSPPYADGARQEGTDAHPDRMEGTPHAPARYDLAVSSPPYSESNQDYEAGWKTIDPSKAHNRYSRNREASYGTAAGQLGAMSAGDFDAAVSSPPFLQQSGGTNVTSSAGPLSDPRLVARHAAGNAAAKGYGQQDGQLGAMGEGDFDAAVSSPPFENVMRSTTHGIDWKTVEPGRLTPGRLHARLAHHDNRRYGDSDGQIGIRMGDNFWTAARLIVEQTYAALAPGAHAVWVTKGFVRDRQLVDFPDQWRRLCEAAGFVTLHQHRAWVVEHHGTQTALDGTPVPVRVERKSFFRRMVEKRGSPRIDYETVWCMEKRS